MASKDAVPQESLQQRLDAARQAATEASAQVGSLESRLRTAISEERFDDAHALKLELPDAEHAWTHAAADLRSIEIALDELAQRRAQREAAEAAERRRQAAVGNLNAAAARERAGMDELLAVRAELVAGIGAVQDTIRRGYLLEQQVKQARSDIHQARMDAGDADGPTIISGPNNVSALCERSEHLLAIMRGTALPS